MRLSNLSSAFCALALLIAGCGGTGSSQATPFISEQSSVKSADTTPPPPSTTPNVPFTAGAGDSLGPPISHVDHLTTAQKNALRAQGATEAVLTQIDDENDRVNVILKEEASRKPQFFRDRKFEQFQAQKRKTQAYVVNDSRTRPGVYYVTTDNFSSGLPFPGHAAMVSHYPGLTVEAFGNGPIQSQGVKYHLISEWNRRHFLARTANATNTNLDLWAAIYAEQQVNKPYNYNYLRPMDTDSFYCSSLIWNAFRLYAGVDIVGFGSTPYYVSPYHLYLSSYAHTIYQQ